MRRWRDRVLATLLVAAAGIAAGGVPRAWAGDATASASATRCVWTPAHVADVTVSNVVPVDRAGPAAASVTSGTAQ